MYLLFDFFKDNKIKDKDNEKFLISPQTGRITSLREIPDEVFSEKILGDGAAIVPEENIVVSPVDGEIVQLADAGHVYCIKSDDGLDILIHIGVDTIGMKGKGFKYFVKVGQKVKAGEPIGEADINLIEENGYSTYTALLVTNMNSIKNINYIPCQAKAGKTSIIAYTKFED